MREFSTRIDIAASPDTVWSVLREFERWPTWTASMSRIVQLDPGPPQVGTRVRVRQPRLLPTVWQITAWEPGRRFMWVARWPGLRTPAEHLLSARPGGCTVTLRVRFEGLLAVVAGPAWRALTERYLALEASGLKAVCERGA